jgi:lysophospholipase L1-like esterase
MKLPSARALLARLLLLGVSAVLSLAAAEVAVRIVRPQAVMRVSQGLYVPDPPRRYRLQPGFEGTVTNRAEFDTRVVVNQEGLRGRPIGPKPPGTLRILALGDSFTFGVGAQEDETYPARLQAALRQRGLLAEVLNAGAPGFGVPDEAAWYQAWGVPLQPDLALVAVFMANDLQDAAPGGPKAVARDGYLVIPGETGGLKRWLYYHSHLYVLLKNALSGPLRKALGLPQTHADREVRAEFDLYASPPSAMVRGGAAATDRAVAELVRAARASHTRVAAVLIPSLLQVDGRAWKAALARFALDPARYDPDRPNALFRALFERHGVPVLDLTGPFRQAIREGKEIYYPIDQHLRPEGYDLLARQAADFLMEKGILGRPGPAVG